MADIAAKKTLRLSYSHTIGIVAMEGREFSGPSDLAIASDGRMYVPNRANPDQPYRSAHRRLQRGQRVLRPLRVVRYGRRPVRLAQRGGL